MMSASFSPSPAAPGAAREEFIDEKGGGAGVRLQKPSDAKSKK
jgi:hypothetical protein